MAKPKHKSKAQSTCTLAIKMDPKTKKRLQKLGELKERAPHWLMKEAIERYLIEEEYSEQLKQETLSRWQEALSGKVVDYKTVTTWLDTWDAKELKDRPECEN